jgi:agmatine deiminase
MSNAKVLILSITSLLGACETSTDGNGGKPSVTSVKVVYTMPEESEPHEGTWLQLPHEHQYGFERYHD